jgi:hypothetical protein
VTSNGDGREGRLAWCPHAALLAPGLARFMPPARPAHNCGTARDDLIIEEALAGKVDPLHPAAVLGFGLRTRLRYATAAQDACSDSVRDTRPRPAEGRPTKSKIPAGQDELEAADRRPGKGGGCSRPFRAEVGVLGRPVLTKWLAGAHASHPLLRPEMPGWFLDTLELIVSPVDAADPLRLPTKIKAFCTLTTDAGLLEQRAELLIGSMLARGGIPFEFGKDHPDYVLRDQALGIEVGSRALDGPWALHDRLEELLAASGSDVFVQLSFDDGRLSSAPPVSRRSPRRSPPIR